LFKLGKPCFDHRFEGQLPLLGTTLVEPRQALPHAFQPSSEASLQGVIY
jgi:hypothetical protein